MKGDLSLPAVLLKLWRCQRWCTVAVAVRHAADDAAQVRESAPRAEPEILLLMRVRWLPSRSSAEVNRDGHGSYREPYRDESPFAFACRSTRESRTLITTPTGVSITREHTGEDKHDNRISTGALLQA